MVSYICVTVTLLLCQYTSTFVCGQSNVLPTDNTGYYDQQLPEVPPVPSYTECLDEELAIMLQDGDQTVKKSRCVQWPYGIDPVLYSALYSAAPSLLPALYGGVLPQSAPAAAYGGAGGFPGCAGGAQYSAPAYTTTPLPPQYYWVPGTNYVVVSPPQVSQAVYACQDGSANVAAKVPASGRVTISAHYPCGSMSFRPIPTADYDSQITDKDSNWSSVTQLVPEIAAAPTICLQSFSQRIPVKEKFRIGAQYGLSGESALQSYSPRYIPSLVIRRAVPSPPEIPQVTTTPVVIPPAFRMICASRACN